MLISISTAHKQSDIGLILEDETKLVGKSLGAPSNTLVKVMQRTNGKE